MGVALDKISAHVCDLISEHIAAAGGNEVFFTGTLDDDGVVKDVVLVSRGHKTAVPVIDSALKDSDVLIHNHPSGNLDPSDADLAIASRTAEAGLGFYIIDNKATYVYVVVEPVLKKAVVLIDIERIRFLLGESGPFAGESHAYEERPSQIELAVSIAKAFNAGSIGVFEAGTGVGKSFAYLLPAMRWALDNKERVLISTGTINLQQQLVEKDIPAAVRMIGEDVLYVLIKGRQNYVCRRRLAETIADNDLFADETEELSRIAAWAATTSDGSKTDLSFVPKEVIWSRICSESDTCMGIRCAFHENCFVMKVRKEAASAQILVVNHHLLFADLEVRMMGAGYDDVAVLPPFQHIVFDEAHGMEDAATSFFSEFISRFKLNKQVSVFYRFRRGAVSGHLYQLERLSSAQGQAQNAVAAVQSVKEAYSALEDEALLVLGSETSWRLSAKTVSQAHRLLECFTLLRSAVAALAGCIREVLEGIDDEQQNEMVVWESKFALRRLEFIGTLSLHFCEWDERRESVYWIEKLKQRDGTWYPRFVQTPLTVSQMMKEGVFEPFKTIICVSATLRIGTSFDYWFRRTGVHLVEDERLLSGVYDSPFPYRKNVLVAIPDDAPLPESDSFQPWIETAIISLIQASGGHALVLFTSYDSLRKACTLARSILSPLGMNILKQGDDDRSRLLETFKDDESSVLFATDSFWEGVDAPGDALLHVIIVKLPFRVPNDPVHSARSEAIELAGGNPFMELSLPEAVVRFRQGFGRLMRRNSDRGAVTILDRRILAKKYGSIFLSSLPETKQCFAPLSEVVLGVERFIY